MLSRAMFYRRACGARYARKSVLSPTQKPINVLAAVKRLLLGIFVLFLQRKMQKKTAKIPAVPPQAALLTYAARIDVLEASGRRTSLHFATPAARRTRNMRFQSSTAPPVLQSIERDFASGKRSGGFISEIAINISCYLDNTMIWFSLSSTKQEGKETPMSKPSHTAYVVIDPKEGSEKKAIWRRVGSVWPHKKGNGFDVVIDPQISVCGRITCTEPKEKADAE
jgi:hypothetical protein